MECGGIVAHGEIQSENVTGPQSCAVSQAVTRDRHPTSDAGWNASISVSDPALFQCSQGTQWERAQLPTLLQPT